MAYRIQGAESPGLALRRIADEQIRRALGEIEDEDLGVGETVHQVRKRCKKLRGLLRLVRDAHPGYSEENAWFRDWARALSRVRDAASLLECCDALAQRFEADLRGAPVGAIREELRKRYDNEMSALDASDRLDRLHSELEEAARRVADWRLEERGFAALGGGLRRSYRRARAGLKRARRSGDTDSLHEWRKRVKYHHYHLRLLRELWPPVMKPLRYASGRLADRLGDDHDLAVLRDVLVAEAERFPDRERELLTALIDRRRHELQARAFPLGMRLFATGSGRMQRRVERVGHLAARAPARAGPARVRGRGLTGRPRRG